MSEGNAGENGAGNGLAQAEVAESRGLSVLWIIPVVAAVIAAGLAYRTLSERGPLITISFRNAEGLTVGKTEARYLDVPFGTVESVNLEEDLSGVSIGVRIKREADKHMTKGARFWVVRPRVGAGGVSGLDTLISGSYIAFYPGPEDSKAEETPPVRHFVGLETPPLDVGDPRALRIVLDADRLGDIANGSPVYHRDIEVGRVVGHELKQDGQSVTIHAMVGDEHAKLVRASSHFWNVSGINVDASWTGVDVSLESVRSLLLGGIAFDTPDPSAKTAASGDTFHLYSNEEASEKARKSARTHHFVLEAKGLGSLRPGEPVLYHGIQVGSVMSASLKEDAADIGVMIGIEPEYARLVRTNSVFWNASGITADLGLSGLHVHASSLESLMAGGVAFATPDEGGPPAASGSVFALHDGPQKHWLDWHPKIWLGSDKDKNKPKDAVADQKPELVHYKGKAAGPPGSHHWWSHLFGKKD